jgi:hypothetical protein
MTMGTPPPKPPTGQRFSHVYLKRGEPTQDSPRMRRRIASLISSTPDISDSITDWHRLGQYVENKLGIGATWSTSDDWTKLLSKWQLADVLDAVTLVYQFLVEKKSRGIRSVSAPELWISEVNNIFREENVHYIVDDRGGVHFKFDDEFARNAAAAIAVLQLPRYANARDAFERGMAALASAPPDGKSAIRGVFSATECIFRLMLPKVPRLGAAELEGLSPLLDKLYANENTARRASTKLLGSLKDWTDAAHFYRHEEGAQEVAQPPLNLAIYLVSGGASHLRWLAELDTQMQD